MLQFKIIVEKHADGYVAYPLGLKGVVLGQGDTYDESLADVKSAIRFHIETFGKEVIDTDESVIEAFVAGAGVAIPVDARREKVIKALESLGFRLVPEREHVAMLRENPDGTLTPLTLPNDPRIKGATLRAICSQAGIPRAEFMSAYERA